jgi:hypothetical protein
MRKLTRFIIALIIAAVSGVTFGFVTSKQDPQARYEAAVRQAETQLKKAQTHCEGLVQDEMRLCMALALAEKWRALAQAEVQLNDTPEARRSARVANAGGQLLVALQKCSGMNVAERGACRTLAKDSFIRELAKARAVEVKEQACYPAECTWLPGLAPRSATVSL